jgi:hypothetical protein
MGDLDRLIRLRGYLDETRQTHGIDSACEQIADFLFGSGADPNETRQIVMAKIRAAFEKYRR